MNRTNIAVALGGGLVLVLLAGAIFDIGRVPMPHQSRAGDGGIVGVDAGMSMAWVITTETGVVLVDAGWDAAAEALKQEVGDRKVHAILLTHAHFDHTAAVRMFPDARVIVGPGESQLLAGGEAELGWMAGMSTMMAPEAYVPADLTEFSHGELLAIDGVSVRALHVPGHTHGSAMYIYEDVLFTGDTIVGRGGTMNRIPRGTYTDYDIVRDSVRGVMEFPFERVADGHVGLHENARTQVQAFLDAE